MDLEQKLRLYQKEHKSNIDLLEGNKKAQHEEIQRLKEENQKLRTRLLKRKTLVVVKDEPSQPEYLQSEVDHARKEGDELKVQVSQVEKHLDELRDQVRALDLELQGPSSSGGTASSSATTSSGGSSADNPTTARIHALEERLEKSQGQSDEAQAILTTYEQIIKRLKEERISFDQQLSALERTLQLKNNDLEELLLLSGDANHARDLAQQELTRQRAKYEDARRQREADLRERQRVIHLRLKKRKQEREQEKKSGKSVAFSGGVAVGVGKKEDDDERGDQDGEENDDLDNSQECEEELESLQQASRRIKDMMGISEACQVTVKLSKQTETLDHLLLVSQENQTRLAKLQEERNAVKAQVDKLRYLPRGEKLQGIHQQLVRRRERLGHLRGKFEAQVSLLNSIKCSVTKQLWETLKKEESTSSSSTSSQFPHQQRLPNSPHSHHLTNSTTTIKEKEDGQQQHHQQQELLTMLKRMKTSLVTLMHK